MSVWVWSAEIGVFVGLTIFVLSLTPIVSWQYRRFGRLSVARLIGACAVSVYAAALVTYTQLPLPESRSLAWCEVHGVGGVQLTPFESFNTMLLRAQEIGWGPMLTSTLGLQVIFNIVLMIPLGIIVRGLLHKSWITATFSGFLVSLAIEVTQATGVLGVYPCAYRLGDVDDLITNTLGALVGALIAPAVLFWMPKRERLEAQRLIPRPITALRRFTGMLLNYGLIWSISSVLSFTVMIVWRLIDGKLDLGMMDWVNWAIYAATVVAVLYVPAMKGCGSLGMYVVWLEPRWSRNGVWHRGTLWQRIARTSVLGLPLMCVGMPGFGVAEPVFFLLAMIACVLIPGSRNRRSLSGIWVRAELVDSRV